MQNGIAARHAEILGDGNCACGFCTLTRERDTARALVAETIEYLTPRIGNLPHSRGYQLLMKLSASLIRKESP